MKGIEERVKQLYPTADDWDSSLTLVAEKDGYIKGAKEQKKVDIKKAQDWLEYCLPNIEYITNACALRLNKEQFIAQFVQVMEEGQ